MEGWPANDPSAPISRERQIELMQTAEERVKASLEYWRSKPKVQRAYEKARPATATSAASMASNPDALEEDEMSEIPEDVMRAARNAAEFYAQWLHAGNSLGHLSPHAIDGLIDSIAHAMMAERKRAAKVAEAFDKAHGKKIADAIRNGARP